jgi:hypothetical protein
MNRTFCVAFISYKDVPALKDTTPYYRSSPFKG